jgi:ribose-phosphate pyrophosphokinase
MISTGDSILEVARALKKRKARRVFICGTFGLFTDGIEKFDEAYKEGVFDKILTTNLIYQRPELKTRPWYVSCNMSKYVAYLVDTLNHDSSISDLLDPREKILNIVNRYHEKQQNGGTSL